MTPCALRFSSSITEETLNVRASTTSIIGDLGDAAEKSRERGTGVSLTNGSQPRYTDGINLHSCLQPRGNAKPRRARAHMTKHPSGKESMNTSSDVSPGDTRRKKAERENTDEGEGEGLDR